MSVITTIANKEKYELWCKNAKLRYENYLRKWQIQYGGKKNNV